MHLQRGLKKQKKQNKEQKENLHIITETIFKTPKLKKVWCARAGEQTYLTIHTAIPLVEWPCEDFWSLWCVMVLNLSHSAKKPPKSFGIVLF